MPWPQVVLRAAKRKSYISRGTGLKALTRALDALSLVCLGEVVVAVEIPGQRPKGILEVLVNAPVLRFDPIMANVPIALSEREERIGELKGRETLQG